ncbi:hypothetical protein D3C83_156210 [compost metagenome]
MRRHVFQDRSKLLLHKLSIHHLYPANSLRVLYGQQSDDSLAIDAVLMKGLQVGLQTCPAAGVRAGDR